MKNAAFNCQLWAMDFSVTVFIWERGAHNPCLVKLHPISGVASPYGKQVAFLASALRIECLRMQYAIQLSFLIT